MPIKSNSVNYILVYSTSIERIGSEEWRCIVYHKTVQRSSKSSSSDPPQYGTKNYIDFEWRNAGKKFWRPSRSWPFFNAEKPFKGLPRELFENHFTHQRAEILAAVKCNGLRYVPPRKLLGGKRPALDPMFLDAQYMEK